MRVNDLEKNKRRWMRVNNLDKIKKEKKRKRDAKREDKWEIEREQKGKC